MGDLQHTKGRRWCAAQVKPRQEALASAHLDRQNFPTYWPLLERMRRIRGRNLTVREPLFPGYVFVSVDLDRDRWRAIDGTIGVLRLVRFGQQPALLPDRFVESFRQRTGEDGVLRFDEELKSGDDVMIVGGAFDGLHGVLIGEDAKGRVTVLLRILSGEREIRLPRSSLTTA